jgi:hypothetical protein
MCKGVKLIALWGFNAQCLTSFACSRQLGKKETSGRRNWDDKHTPECGERRTLPASMQRTTGGDKGNYASWHTLTPLTENPSNYASGAACIANDELIFTS